MTQPPFFMPIDDIFDEKARGVMLVGDIVRGSVRDGDLVEFLGFSGVRQHTVALVEPAHGARGSAAAGERAGLLIAGLAKDGVHRGEVVAAPGSICRWRRVLADLLVLPAEQSGRDGPFFSGFAPQFYLWGADTAASVILPEEVERAMPGQRLMVEFDLRTRRPLELGTAFALREGGRTVANGTISALIEAANDSRELDLRPSG